MGLLDDAIREHLELKRRRGADATEISRQESDALGPVRRSPEGVPDLTDLPPLQDAAVDAEPDALGVPEEPSPWEQDVHTPPSEPIYEPPPVPAAPAPPPPAAYEPPAAPPPPIADEPPTAADEAPADDSSHPSLLSRLNPAGRIRHARRDQADEPAAPEPPPLPPEPPTAAEDLPPAAYEPPPAHEPDVIPADDEPEGEELLEETPDFLEETPEHDRLWFEQRPPRDFNFDD
ncbi:MAG: hypothetical protein QOJ85_3530 [Solirubrobacteraceae bacterium]|jgi:hypothetical protein|nr:hypothetical protein [Solirubrobacteraceae bacterium]